MNEHQKRMLAYLKKEIEFELEKLDLLLVEIKEYRADLNHNWEMHKLTVNISLN